MALRVADRWSAWLAEWAGQAAAASPCEWEEARGSSLPARGGRHMAGPGDAGRPRRRRLP